MTQRFTAEALERIREAVPISHVIERTVRLERRRNLYVGLCPFHQEKTPSFTVYERHAHCYGCGWHGDVIRFVIEQNKLTFREAVESLAVEAGLQAGEIRHDATINHQERRRRDAEARQRQEARRRQEEADRARDQLKAADRADGMIRSATLAQHPYLEAKGFPDQRAFVLDDALLVPMRPIDNYRKVANIQRIGVDGSKKFLYGGQVLGTVLHVGSGAEQWWCEGYATALSIQAALALHYRRVRVSVCFSARNIAKVARRGFVVVDHDWWRCRNKHRWDEPRDTLSATCPHCGAPGTAPTGARWARETGLPWWQPPEPGEDANDFHRRWGVDILADALREVGR